jgi:hypothetical protein
LKEKGNITQGIKKGVAKAILYLFLIIFFILSVVVLSMQSSFVQTKVAQYGSEYLSQKLGFEITIEKINIEWFDQLVISNLLVKDLDHEDFIEADRLRVDYDIKQLLMAENIALNDVALSNAKVYLVRDKGENYFNIDNLIIAIRNLSSSDKKNQGTSKTFIINHIKLENITLGIANMNADSITEGFNYNQFLLTALNADINNFSTISDTIQMKVNELSAIDSTSGLYIKKLSTDFEISQSRMSLTKLDLTFNDSHLADSVVFTYNSISNMSYLIDSVKMNVNFTDTKITAKDLAFFAPYLQRYQDNYRLSGEFSGRIKNFNVKDIQLYFGNSSYLAGDLHMDGLPNFNESFIDFTVDKASVLGQDLNQYIADSVTNRKIGIVNNFNFEGNFIGFPKDFVANGVFTSPLGRIESDLNLKITSNIAESVYKGNISTFNFNIGKLLEVDSIFQKVQMTGNVNGKGLSLATANLKLKANIGFIGINGYEYQNIKTNAQLSTGFFNGSLKVSDSKLKLDMLGSIDLRDQKNIINVDVKLDTVNLKNLKITTEDVIIKASGSLQSEGKSLETVNGEVYLNNVYAKYRGNSLNLDTLGIITGIKNNYRKLQINSDLVSGSINGDYTFIKLTNDIQTLIKEVKLNIENDAEAIAEYYLKVDTINIPTSYQVLYDLNVKKINPLVKLFLPQLYVKPNSKLHGSFSYGANSIFNLNAIIDSVNYSGSSFKANELDISLSKDYLSKTVLGMAYIYSRDQLLFDKLITENIETELIWTGQDIDFSAYLKQPEFDNTLDISGLLTFKEDTTQISVLQSNIHALNNNWYFNENNLFYISNKKLHFESFGIASDSQSILINGIISNDSSEFLMAEVDNFNLEGINTLTSGREIQGLTNGVVKFNKLNNKYIILSDLAIKDFYVDNFLVGDITGKSNWQDLEKKLDLDFMVNRLGKDIITISGDYVPSSLDQTLDLNARLANANLIIAEPFINTIFSELRGFVNGEFKITGNLSYPVINGVGRVTEGQIKVNYLNTLYNFNGDIGFDQDKISLNNIQLKDLNDNYAYLSGNLLHNGFTDLFIDLKGNMNDFQVLNTTAEENKLYYGTAFVSGDVNFYGPAQNLLIEARATSEKGTKMFIPVETTSSVEQEDFIHFINIKDTANQKISLLNKIENVDITGVTLNIDLELTPDAYAEIIFDIKSGDIIRGRGNGKISLNIDNNGAFTMLGDYTLTEGGYNFTLYNIINKEFSIQSGSRITWDGDPYGGNLDIKAIYEQNVSLLPIVDTAYSDSPELKRRYPAQVILDLQGDLLKPKVDFDISISGYPEVVNSTVGSYALGPAMASFEAELQADEQEMKRQVFSLIILRRLSPPSSFAVSGSIGNSVSEFLSNQLSYWVTQIDENLEIDVDLGSFSEEQFNTFQLRLSYSFLDGRLRITRDGGFTQGNTNDVNQEILGILGDWSLEYLLSEDGKLRVKIYNRTNYNALDAITNAVTTSTGVSLVHVSSFNQIKEVFNRNKDKKEAIKKTEEESKEEKQESLPTPEAVIKEEDDNGSNNKP